MVRGERWKGRRTITIDGWMKFCFLGKNLENVLEGAKKRTRRKRGN